MKDLDIIDHHLIIRDTVGYEIINRIQLSDIPKVMEFLTIAYNYQRMKRLETPTKDLLSAILEDRSNANGHDKDGNPKYNFEGYTYILNPSCTEILSVSFLKNNNYE